MFYIDQGGPIKDSNCHHIPQGLSSVLPAQCCIHFSITSKKKFGWDSWHRFWLWLSCAKPIKQILKKIGGGRREGPKWIALWSKFALHISKVSCYFIFAGPPKTYWLIYNTVSEPSPAATYMSLRGASCNHFYIFSWYTFRDFLYTHPGQIWISCNFLSSCIDPSTFPSCRNLCGAEWVWKVKLSAELY